MKTRILGLLPNILVLSVAAIMPSQLCAQTDDFNDGNDDGWTRYDPIGSHPAFPDQATYSFPNGGYRIQVPVSPLPGTVGPARAGSLREDVTYTDFYAHVDVVALDTNVNQSIGLIARVTQPGLAATDGYAMTYNVGGRDLDITRFTNEDPAGGTLAVSGSDDVDMKPGKTYRFVFIGKGPQLTAKAYEHPNLTTPIASITGSDSTYPSGVIGLLVFDNSGGTGTGDATFDNYFAQDVEPPRLSIERQTFGDIMVSWPADAENFVLQRASALSPLPINWQTVTTGVEEQNGVKFLVANEADGNSFFRLFRPAP